MKKLFCFLAALLLLTVPAVLFADDEGESEGDDSFEGEVVVGGHVGDIKDYGGRVSEYTQVAEDGRADGELTLKGEDDGIHWDLFGRYWDTRDQDVEANLDLRRVLDFHYDYVRLPHWLDNDPLTNIEAKAGGKMVTHENTEVGADYIITYGEHNAGLELNPKGAPGLSFSFGFRDQTRKGHRQSRAVSHCANCHVVGQGREIDESTRDLTAGVSWAGGLLNVDYQFLNRQFRENGATPTHFYDNAMHPVRGEEYTDPETGDYFNYGVIFSNRLQYEDEERMVDMVPDVDRDAHRLRANFDLPANSSLVATAVAANVENRYTGLQTDSAGYYGRYTKRWGLRNRWRFNASLRYQKVDTDDVFVDVENSEAYENAWGGSFDWWRLSALNRNVTTALLDMAYRPATRMNLRFGYEWKSTDREYYEVNQAGETTTDANRLFASWNYRPHRRVRTWLSAEYTSIDNPFASPLAVCESDIDDTAYREYYLRDMFLTGDVAARPTSRARLRWTGTWTMNSSLMLSANFRYVDQKNSDLTYADWKRNLLQPGVNINWVMRPEVVFTFGYLHFEEDTEALYSVTVMDG